MKWLFEKKEKSIKEICTSVVMGSAVVSCAFFLILVLAGIYQDYRGVHLTERERLLLIAPLVADTISSEQFINNTHSIDTVRNDLIQKHHLQSITIENEFPSRCSKPLNIWNAFWGNGEQCVAKSVMIGGHEQYVIVESNFPMDIRGSIIHILWFALPLFISGLFITHQIRTKLTNAIVEPIEELAKSPETWNPKNPETAIEARRLHQSFKTYIEERDREKEKAEKLRVDASIGQWAGQVAHDIRSPLTALSVVYEDLSELSENKRIIARSAMSRIMDIITQLLAKNRTTFESIDTVGKRSIELIASHLENIVSEKRLQYRSRFGVEINTKLGRDTYGLFANINVVELCRALSNIIDNSVQAIETKEGSVEVSLMEKGNLVEITVEDSGKGIPENILPLLMHPGASFGKDDGTGHGLSHAKRTLESFGGTLSITSKVGIGTKVVMTLPKGPAPAWFLRDLEIARGTTVVVVDDDPSIHQIWESLLRKRFTDSEEIVIVHHSFPKQLVQWHLSERDKHAKYLFLIDHEFRGCDKSGIDLIKELGIVRDSILVTSHFEEAELRTECERMGLKLIPKSMAQFVPIVEPIRSIVLIDDEPVVHGIWEEAAKESGRKLIGFNKIEDFFSKCNQLDSRTTIYLDSNLGEGIRGEDFAEKIQTEGFANINLITGYAPENFADNKYLRTVSDKTPPF